MRTQMSTMSRMMAISGGAPPGMDDEEMMGALMGGAGPRQVAPGRVRRKKNVLEAMKRSKEEARAESAQDTAETTV